MKKLILLLIVILPLFSIAQNGDKKFGIKFSGFVKNDVFFDTRQTVSSREGHFLLWPANEAKDLEGNDINDKSNFNFLAIQTRLKGTITGPDAFGAKTSGVIEGAFFGMANGDENGFRLRHAFFKLKWTNTELLLGQHWHPMFIAGCFPGTVSFSTGVPFQPFSRNPQVRITQSFGKIKLIGAVLSQRDFASRGPAGTSSVYLRNAGIPDAQFQIHFDSKGGESGADILTGVGLGYKSIVPQLETNLGYKTDEAVSGMSAIAFLKIKIPAITIKLEGAYGENVCDYLSLGGFAVKEVTEVTDPLKDLVTYTPIKVTSFWTDIHTNGKKFQAGIFAGYTKNGGTKDKIGGEIYGLGTNIASILRVAPRVMFNSGKTRFAIEVDYTSATYGSTMDANAIPETTKDISNIRFLFAAYYFF